MDLLCFLILALLIILSDGCIALCMFVLINFALCDLLDVKEIAVLE